MLKEHRPSAQLHCHRQAASAFGAGIAMQFGSDYCSIVGRINLESKSVCKISCRKKFRFYLSSRWKKWAFGNLHTPFFGSLSLNSRSLQTTDQIRPANSFAFWRTQCEKYQRMRSAKNGSVGHPLRFQNKHDSRKGLKDPELYNYAIPLTVLEPYKGTP